MHKNVISITRFAAAALAAVVVSGCEAEKSRNPLSPNVAGPIAGVSISPPTPVNPVNAEVLNTGPVRLVFNNASTNGERPLFYIVELATDAAFTNKVFAQSKVTPGTGNQTSIVVDAALTAERTYFWRAKADDGANESEYSNVAKFDIVVPVVIEAPVPVSPVSGLVASSRSPVFVVNNAGVQGRAGQVEYWFEVALDQAFSRTIVAFGVERSAGSTTSAQMPELPASSLLFWRVVGLGGNRTLAGPWSLTQSFRTPAAAPAPSPGPSPSPTPAPPAGGRTPDPPAGGKLPLPNMFSVVQQVAAQNPGALQNSCQDHGGNWQFMDLLLNELRRRDSRWGYNGKRGNSNDPSKDAIAYHWSRGADEGSTDVYIIDVIGSHCGSPYPAWIDQTEITLNSGTIGRWTGRGRF
jgi:hypothetical protein